MAFDSIGPLALLLAAALAPPAAHPPVAIGNLAEQFGSDAYPADALRANEEGRVAVRLTVDATGKPASCTVATSSGSYALDSGTCDIAMAHLLFAPAADVDGRPVGGVFPFAVRWVMPKPIGGDPLPVTFAGRGDAVTCTVRLNGAVRRLEPEACRSLARAAIAQGGRLDGEHDLPVPASALADEPRP